MRRRATGRFPLRFTRRLVPFKGHRKGLAENGTTVQEARHVGLHIAANIAVITVRRPDQMNAINAKMWTDLTETVRRASRDDRVRALVFRGEGDNFSAGSDLKELGRSSLHHAEDIFHRMEECVATVEESPLPSVACIRGYALGTGLLLGLACDLRVADNGATVGMPIARLGITLTEPFVKRLVSLIGPARMKDLVYTGRLIEAPEALRWGLVDRLVDDDRLVLRETLRIADVITRQSGASIRAAKRWGGSGSGRVPAMHNYVDPEDFPEGVQAFLERRQPRFGRTGKKAPARAKR
jgi:enoyl-CoA hydratase